MDSGNFLAKYWALVLPETKYMLKFKGKGKQRGECSLYKYVTRRWITNRRFA
ncbi:unnamed protein product [Brugia timori]|uniref:Uncharacterized protein n=1 Tax=Brugia timori TaxID=42155 RepID=A0A0R3QLM3_9BILA|nr:unnamed protein product [Brugia timori]